MRYIVGYTPGSRGDEAINLAVTLAADREARIDIVTVLPTQATTYDMYSPDRAYYARLSEHAREWLEDALRKIPKGVNAGARIQYAESTAEGLIRAATDPDWGEEAGLIAIGASNRGPLGLFTVSSIANALLHSAPVPVGLAPAGYAMHAGISKVTVAMGTRQGADALFQVALESAAARQVPLRIMSLVALDAGSEEESAAVAGRAELHTRQLAEWARHALPSECPLSTIVAVGANATEAVRKLEFEDDEFVLVGSSRLAPRRRLFLGPKANKMLRALPVPMIVVPRQYHDAGPSYKAIQDAVPWEKHI